MDDHMVGILKMSLPFLAGLGFCFYQLWSLRRDRKQDLLKQQKREPGERPGE
jgi:hypothetical protein